jgi:hypothetical protein
MAIATTAIMIIRATAIPMFIGVKIPDAGVGVGVAAGGGGAFLAASMPRAYCKRCWVS